ncbi:MAG: pyridoxal phosphate-dependent aminotransferase [Clostridia bacterium]|nr:pyridoxal phosphate-dependent aminotransferase [Clostridia bacterium]
MINEAMRRLGANRSVIREIFEYGRKRKAEIGEDKVFDFSLGNPSVPAPECVNENIKRLLDEVPSATLHGYTSAQGDASVRAAIADYINKTQGECITADCLYMTVGAAAALTCSLTALTGEGEEVIVLAPYFPEYKVFIERTGAKVREVLCDTTTFQPDIAAIESVINERTAAIIINSPNNPTGAVMTEDSIIALTNLLKKKEAELSRVIYLISDEPYRELVYGDAKVPYLTKYYNDTVVCYSYSKSLSLPGERIGYVLVNPRMTDFTSVYQAVAGSGRALGYVCAPSLLQRLIPYCLGKTADIEIYDRNRRILLEKLTEYGYTVIKPDGAFYLFVKALSDDASEFSMRARDFELLLVPSDDFGCGGFVRISYCVTTEQVERSLPAFKALAEAYGK